MMESCRLMAMRQKRMSVNNVSIIPRCRRLEVGEGAVAFSTLSTPLSSGGYFSVAFYTGDNPAHVESCRRGLAAILGVSASQLAMPRQSHTVKVVAIGGVMPELSDVDALVTKRRDIALCVNTADCIPIVFYDPLSHVIGAAHAGWRGVYGGIIAATVDAMRALGADFHDIRAGIGPCIAGKSYEVDAGLASKFEKRFCNAVYAKHLSASPEFSWVTMPVEGHPAKRWLNLPAVAIMQLKACGIPEESIAPPFADSFLDPDYFSYRRDKAPFAGVSEKIGRTATVIMMQ